jgi:hypothetical protein
MRIFLTTAILLSLAASVCHAAPSEQDGWAPLPEAISREVDDYFTCMELALNHNHIEMVMSLYTPDATEEISDGQSGRYGVEMILERREREMEEYVRSSTNAPAIERGALLYQPGRTADSFRIKYLVSGRRVPFATNSAVGDIIYTFRSGEDRIQLSSTVVHPLYPMVVRVMPRMPAVPGCPLPSEVTLTNGLVLHHVTVVQWQPDTVILKHTAGTDPIRLERIAPEDRVYFMANIQRGLAQQKAAYDLAARASDYDQRAHANEQQAQSAFAEKEAEIQEAVSQHRLLVGMTMDQVRASWGPPSRSNSITGAEGQGSLWFYDGRGIDSNGNTANAGVGFNGDVVASLYNVKAR